MIARTEATAADGRPLIEVDAAKRAGDTVTLHGTAVAYEATVILDLVDNQGLTRQSTFVTASVGGPERGTWTATVNVDDSIVKIAVHQEEMEEGTLSTRARTAEIPP